MSRRWEEHEQLGNDQPNAARLWTPVQADIDEPETVLAAPGVTGLLDFSRPTGLLVLDVLRRIVDEAASQSIVDSYRNALPVGSYRVVSHA